MKEGFLKVWLGESQGAVEQILAEGIRNPVFSRAQSKAQRQCIGGPRLKVVDVND